MTDIAVVGFAHAPHVRRTEGTTNGVEMLMPCFAPALRGARAQADRHRLLVLRIVGLPCRPRLFVHLGDRLDRRGAADQRVARRDGRGLGALRGLHQAADRRGRHRAGLRVRQVLGGHAAPGAGAADRPVHRRAAVAGLGVDRGPAGPVRAGRRQVDGRADGPGGAGFVRGRRSAPIGEAPDSSDEEHRRAAGPAVLRGSVAPPRHRADHRRRVGDRAGRGRQGPRAPREPGLDHRFRAPHRNAGARRARPDGVAVDRGVGQGGHGRRQRLDRGGGDLRAVHPSASDPDRGHRACRRRRR